MNTDPPGAAPPMRPAPDAILPAALALSRAYAPPQAMHPDHPLALRRALPTPDDDGGHAPLLALADAWDDALRDPQQLALAYARLFLGPFEILAPPWASFYLEPDRRLMGDVSSWVARAYARAGLVPGAGPREVPDHAAPEWEFVYALTHAHVGSGNADAAIRRDGFVRDHMAQWMPAMCDAIRRADVLPFYSRLADATEHALALFDTPSR